MLDFLPTHVAGIPTWVVIFAATGVILYLLKISADGTNQDRYPTIRLFLYIGTILVALVGVVDVIRWANLW